MGSLVSRVAEQLLVSQEGLCFVELVFRFAFLIFYGSFAALGVYWFSFVFKMFYKKGKSFIFNYNFIVHSPVLLHYLQMTFLLSVM
jgi:hypothetical protein